MPAAAIESYFFSVGIDPSACSTAVTVMQGRSLNGVFDGVTGARTYLLDDSPAGPDRPVYRLHWLYNRVTRLMADTVALTNFVVCIEGYSFGSKSRSHTLAEVGGVIRLAVAQAGASHIYTVAPASWKKAMIGSGSADKKEVIDFLNRTHGTVFKQSENDKADSYALSLLGIRLALPDLGLGRGVMVKHDRECLR